MKADRTKPLSLHRPVTYQITVPGMVDEDRADWASDMRITVTEDEQGSPITTFTADLDQAALHGLLRRLYSWGLPLISVLLKEVDRS